MTDAVPVPDTASAATPGPAPDPAPDTASDVEADGAPDSAVAIYTDYDPLAEVYAAHWGGTLADAAAAVLEELVLGSLGAGAAVLDLCCGTGDLAGQLSRRGFDVTGLDGSSRMLELAAQRAPGARFVQADARRFELPRQYEAVVSLFDSLNHILASDELAAVFANVLRALEPDGRFLFDLNSEAAYLERWDDELGFVEDDQAVLVRIRYDAVERVGSFHATTFAADPDGEGCWRRFDVTLRQRPYEAGDVSAALLDAGFVDVAAFDAEADLGLDGHSGRVFYVARKPGRG
ncbi:MAG: class I SAM-dependent DNA methyltransferase [Anaerolineae bacterium]